MALIFDIKRLGDEDACLQYLEQLRWPAGLECVRCFHKKISRITSRGKTGKPRHLYQCLACRTQFSVRTGTIFQDSHLPLTAWFKAIALVGTSKREVNVNRLKRELNVQYRTAAYLLARIQKAVVSGGRLEIN
jgi:transposase-like protein